MLNPVYGKILIAIGMNLTFFIRRPFDKKSKTIKVAENRMGPREISLLVFMGIGNTALPLLFMTTRYLDGANYPLHPAALMVGTLLLIFYSWLF